MANHLKNRYAETPMILSGMLDVKDRGSLSLGSIVDITSDKIQDATGTTKTTQMQISYLEEKEDRLMFKAESSYFTGRYGLITEAARPNYAASNATQRAKGTYIVSASTLKFSDGSGPYILY
jgi:FtsZ-binding cell division protein ZapB